LRYIGDVSEGRFDTNPSDGTGCAWDGADGALGGLV